MRRSARVHSWSTARCRRTDLRPQPGTGTSTAGTRWHTNVQGDAGCLVDCCCPPGTAGPSGYGPSQHCGRSTWVAVDQDVYRAGARRPAQDVEFDGEWQSRVLRISCMLTSLDVASLPGRSRPAWRARVCRTSPTSPPTATQRHGTCRAAIMRACEMPCPPGRTCRSSVLPCCSRITASSGVSANTGRA